MTDLQIKNSQQPQQAGILRQALASVTPTDGMVEIKRIEENDQSGAVDQKQEKGEEIQQLQEKVSQLNDYMQNINRSLQFTVDEKSGSSVVIVRDLETDEIIRQFPSEEILNARRPISLDESKGDAGA
ncbi:MAG: flagellar protein FlaG [Gammaproteobacteria bacterium]|nr:flagellar protein FlaG [Gammaproteobacteria bacterium]